MHVNGFVLKCLHRQAPEKNDIEMDDIAGSYAQAWFLHELMFARIVLIGIHLISDVIHIGLRDNVIVLDWLYSEGSFTQQTATFSMSYHTLAQAMMERAVLIPGTLDRLHNIPAEWLSASTCTGCGTFEIALRSVANAVSEHRPVHSDTITATCHKMSFMLMISILCLLWWFVGLFNI